jgi:hypothetical protein
MSKKGNYIGGSTVINTMSHGRAKHLNDRMFKHLSKSKPRKSDEALSPDEVSKILYAEIQNDVKKERKLLRQHAKERMENKELQERYEFLQRKKEENPSQYPKLNKQQHRRFPK